MASLTITIPDPAVPRLRAAFAYRLGMDVADVDVEVVRQHLTDVLKDIVRAAEVRKAAEDASAAVGPDIEAT